MSLRRLKQASWTGEKNLVTVVPAKSGIVPSMIGTSSTAAGLGFGGTRGCCAFSKLAAGNVARVCKTLLRFIANAQHTLDPPLPHIDNGLGNLSEVLSVHDNVQGDCDARHDGRPPGGNRK